MCDYHEISADDIYDLFIILIMCITLKVVFIRNIF